MERGTAFIGRPPPRGGWLVALGLAAAAVAAETASAGFEAGKAVMRGVAPGERAGPPEIRPVPGPRPGLDGGVLSRGDVVLQGALRSPLRGRGSLMFWFHLDQTYRSGTAASLLTETLVELPGAFRVSFEVEKSAVTLAVEWDGRREEVFEKHVRVILPELPGPAWHHVAVNWDGAAGEANVFLDGTPYYVPGEKLPRWRIGTATSLKWHAGRFPVADLRLGDAPVSEAEVRARVGPERTGALAALLGAKELGPPAVGDGRGATLYESSLGAEAAVDGWRLEGPGRIAHRDGWMEVRSERPEGPQGHVVFWCPHVFPERWVAEWDFELLEPKGLCIVFFAAQGRHGRDLFDPSLGPRDGVFRQYTLGDIDCYHISYFANTPDVPRAVANLRKNHGFYLLSNGPVGVPVAKAGTVHRALLVKDGAHVSMAVDGRRIIDYVDDGIRAGPVWGQGRIGLRQMQWTVARYRNFRVSEPEGR